MFFDKKPGKKSGKVKKNRKINGFLKY